MANADKIYANPSTLLKLYLKEPESRAMTAWRTRTTGSLPITHHGRLEISNAIALAVHRGFVTEEVGNAALAAFDDDLAEARYLQADLLWRATLKKAGEISRAHTPQLGCRTLDIIHVASALELATPHFVTFDRRQQQLAAAVGLKLLNPVAKS